MKGYRKGISFQLQIFFAFSTISLVIALFYYQKNLNLQNKILETNFIKNNDLISKTVKLGLEVGLKSDNFQAISDVFEYAKQQKDLNWIIITDGSGEEFAHYPQELKLEQAWDQAKEKGFSSEKSKFYISENNYQTSLASGKIIISFKTDSYQHMKNTLKRESFTLSTGVLFAALLFSFLFSKFLMNSLSSLQQTMAKISDGEFYETIKSKSRTKEIQSLTSSFNFMMEQINLERDRSENLLLNILPKRIADRLRNNETTIAMSNPKASILFADLVGYTNYSKDKAPEDVVYLLNEIFSHFDEDTRRLGLEKIKTIGDSYMVAGGLFSPEDEADKVFQLAKNLQNILKDLNQKFDSDFQVRIGIHTGPVVAGVIGKIKFSFDIWGNTVNFASRLESNGLPGHIQISHEMKRSLDSKGISTHEFSPSQFTAKGLGDVSALIL